ncbi:hypothetical protein HU200_058616 [Digitaria exilis]|uniref:Uncharacterized protein n=1 Tax=Digitaria exilis TaxID=1010633 RepID=A0A835AJG2_9POAL|nr:hypothetical protein HU200_058616 [Digitaria exilis]CAB3493027.1 unnamed protein product [Digitaria exilis]
MSGADADAPASEHPRACRDASRRRRLLLLRQQRDAAIARAIRAPLADVLRDHALVHLPPSAAARLRLVHPSWARAFSSPLFAVAHAAAPRRASGLFVSPPPSSSASGCLLPFEAADTVPSPTLAFLPSSSPPTVLSSSHGVACCFSATDDAYFVCNPATASWVGVPCPPCRITWPRPAIVVVFDAGAYNFSGDFTLVCAFEPSAPGGSSGIYCFAVFTSVSGAWWVADVVALAEGLIPASGVAAGGVAWWRTAIGTAVGYDPVAGCVQLVTCPGDSAQWEIGSAAGTLHCAVRFGDHEVMVFRLDGHGGWEVAAAVSIAEILDRPWQPRPAYDSDSDEEAAHQAEQDHTGSMAIAAAAAARPGGFWMARDQVRLLPFQGAEVEVVVLDDRRVVAFEAVTRRRREAVLPDEPTGTDWGAAAYVAHTNTLAMVAPVVLMEPPEDQEEVAS